MDRNTILGVFVEVVDFDYNWDLKIIHRGAGSASVRKLFRQILDHRDYFGIGKKVTLNDMCRAFTDGGLDGVNKLMGDGQIVSLEADQWLSI